MYQRAYEAKIAAFRTRYGPWALVAGASQGLGAEFAAQLAARGLNLALAARREPLLQSLAGQLAGEHGVQVRSIPIDLAGERGLDQLVEQTQDLEIGLLVYNAAYSTIGPFLTTSLDDHLKEIETNCRAPLTLAFQYGRRMLPRGHGGIVLMSSLSSAQGSALIANYAATKAYNRILAEGLWEELRGQGLDVLACSAGAISTPAYLDSLEEGNGRGQSFAMPPGPVVRETLDALGSRPGVIPGAGNRLAAFVMQRLLPHTAAIRLMGRVLRDMYSRY